MNRIDKMFKRLDGEGRKALIGYLTAGDPSEPESEQNMLAAINAGIDMLELGVPFSDATADGPTIQQAAQRALSGGMNVGRVIDMVRRLREKTDAPIVLFGYVNPFFNYGYQRLCSEASEAGVDGLLVVDLPVEESWEIRRFVESAGMYLVPLIAPTTPDERAARVVRNGGGFVYYIMIKGVTGARSGVSNDVSEHVGALRKVTDLPVAVGFGVSSGTQARQVSESADAVVVGSALIRAARDGRLVAFVSELRNSLEGG
ncbi:MAG: tryptophan synthase subunit alpha [Verrucomicrobiota bacterium]